MLEELHNLLSDFHPVVIGDPIGSLGDTHYFGPSTHWLCMVLFALLAFTFAWWLARRKKTSKRWLLAAIATVLSGLFGYGIGLANETYWGGPFNYDGYQIPKTPSDVIIWFSGADEGAYGPSVFLRCDIDKVNEEFGEQRAAMFNFNDVDKALDFADRLPDGGRLIVRGHSMGGAAAARFACRYKREIALLDTRDPTSWFNKLKQKPANVKIWRTVLPGDTGLSSKYDHPTTATIFGYNAANLYAWLGGTWGPRPGALNLTLPYADHTDVSNMLE